MLDPVQSACIASAALALGEARGRLRQAEVLGPASEKLLKEAEDYMMNIFKVEKELNTPLKKVTQEASPTSSQSK